MTGILYELAYIPVDGQTVLSRAAEGELVSFLVFYANEDESMYVSYSSNLLSHVESSQHKPEQDSFNSFRSKSSIILLLPS